MRQVDYLIVGAGPTGLGAAYRLKKLGVSSFLVLESTDKVGGLSASYRDNAGFTWDVGGHVLFSKNDEFLRLMNELMGEDLLLHTRRARVQVLGRWTDYPFQDHIHQLDDASERRCREGLANAPGPGPATENFADWIRHSFGNGIAECFMEPYNCKVWAFPLHLMGFNWVHERVSPGRNNQRVNLSFKQKYNGWGLNSRFRYPRNGGIGAIFNRLAEELRDHIILRNEVAEINLQKQTAKTLSGIVFRYKALLSTVPLNRLVKHIIRPEKEDIFNAADLLKFNSVSIVGVGIDSPGDRNTSWMYFPGADVPFYRLTNLHNYAPSITPKNGGQSALMAEIAFPGGHKGNAGKLVSDVIFGIMKSGGLENKEDGRIRSTWHFKAPYGYPIPTLGRDKALCVIHPYLEHYQVYSRGRFGGWKYEVGNMDHCVLQGVEWAERIVNGSEEIVFSLGKGN